MGLRAAVLTILLTLLAWPAAGASAGQPKCLRCHPPHYTERGGCLGCHRGDGRSDRPAIAHRDLIRARYSWYAVPGSEPLRRGEKLVDGFACRRCHTLAGKGNRLASNLDRVAQDNAPEKLRDAIRSPALFMPDFKYDEPQLTGLVNAILAGVSQGGPAGRETPRVVHFVDVKRRVENIFEKKCGPCHKVLTQTSGALGKGDIGPNLSGLFSEFYPVTLKDNARWKPETLKKWLENPRKIRKYSQMQPVALKKEEFDKLLAIWR